MSDIPWGYVYIAVLAFIWGASAAAYVLTYIYKRIGRSWHATWRRAKRHGSVRNLDVGIGLAEEREGRRAVAYIMIDDRPRFRIQVDQVDADLPLVVRVFGPDGNEMEAPELRGIAPDISKH